MNFYGETDHQLDEKGRLFVPRRFQAMFDQGGFLTRALNGRSLVFYPNETWYAFQKRLEQMIEQLYAQGPSRFIEAQTAADKLQRFFNSGCPVTMDAQGRLVIPPNLRRRARLDRDVTLIAMGDRLEIWDTPTLEEYDDAEMTPSAIAQAMRAIFSEPSVEPAGQE